MVGAGTNRTQAGFSGGPAIVLVRPQLAVNIGMCARAMVNFGLSDLRLVAPREGWPRNDAHRDTAYAAAAGAGHLLDTARVFETLPDAIADLNLVFATTARERGQGKRIEAPVDAMAEARAHIDRGERIGVLFGPERTGLDNDEVGLADAIVTFPVNPAYASLNLAQAVLLVGYEWMRAADGHIRGCRVIAGGREIIRLPRAAVAGRSGDRAGHMKRDRDIRERGQVDLHGIAESQRPRRDRRPCFAAKGQRAAAGEFDSGFAAP